MQIKFFTEGQANAKMGKIVEVYRRGLGLDGAIGEVSQTQDIRGGHYDM